MARKAGTPSLVKKKKKPCLSILDGSSIISIQKYHDGVNGSGQVWFRSGGFMFMYPAQAQHILLIGLELTRTLKFQIGSSCACDNSLKTELSG